jgi:hypothetical protein
MLVKTMKKMKKNTMKKTIGCDWEVFFFCFGSQILPEKIKSNDIVSKK